MERSRKTAKKSLNVKIGIRAYFRGLHDGEKSSVNKRDESATTTIFFGNEKNFHRIWVHVYFPLISTSSSSLTFFSSFQQTFQFSPAAEFSFSRETYEKFINWREKKEKNDNLLSSKAYINSHTTANHTTFPLVGRCWHFLSFTSS